MRNPTGVPNPVDVHVGGRVRQRRLLLGMSQTNLGDALGLTFQQVQKYESGANRVGASRLFHLSQILDVSIEYFFGDMPADVAAKSPAHWRSSVKKPVSDELDPMAKRETLELVRAYYRIPDFKVRKRLFELAKAVAGASNGEA
jgi:transcriptional regulator with XRE-family HTH domain